MTTPSPETVAAALRLADAVHVYWDGHGGSGLRELEERLVAYRATLPKLRTRAEVDAEIAETARLWIANVENTPAYSKLKRLCAEPVNEGP